MARTRTRDILPEIEGLVDLIFGLALSIGALILINTIPTNPSQVLNDIIAFTYGFVILVFIWEEITQEMLLFKVETRGMLRVTYIMLFLVTLEPYLFNLITQHTPSSSIDDLASSLYALDLASLMLILAFFSQKIIGGEGNLSEGVRKRYLHKRGVFLFEATIFVVSIIPIFWDYSIGSTKLRFILWLLAPAVGLLWGLGGRFRDRKVASEESDGLE